MALRVILVFLRRRFQYGTKCFPMFARLMMLVLGSEIFENCITGSGRLIKDVMFIESFRVSGRRSVVSATRLPKLLFFLT